MDLVQNLPLVNHRQYRNCLTILILLVYNLILLLSMELQNLLHCTLNPIFAESHWALTLSCPFLDNGCLGTFLELNNLLEFIVTKDTISVVPRAILQRLLVTQF